MSKPDVKTQEAQVLAARENFMATLHEVQHRLHPKTIATDVKEKAKEKADGAMSAAKDGMVHAATHPSTVAAITIPVLVYFFRKPIARGMNALFHRGTDADGTQRTEVARVPASPSTKPVAAPKARAKQGA